MGLRKGSFNSPDMPRTAPLPWHSQPTPSHWSSDPPAPTYEWRARGNGMMIMRDAHERHSKKGPPTFLLSLRLRNLSAGNGRGTYSGTWISTFKAMQLFQETCCTHYLQGRKASELSDLSVSWLLIGLFHSLNSAFAFSQYILTLKRIWFLVHLALR